MFTSIRKYQVRRGSVEELARRVLDGFVPLLRQMKGFSRPLKNPLTPPESL
jgi:hypothetical protein